MVGTASPVCYGTVGWFCQAPEPAPEACDFFDNDCDGEADEDFKDAAGKYSSNEHCGACGVSCDGAILNASAECDPTLVVPQCVVTSCDNGWEKYSGEDISLFSYVFNLSCKFLLKLDCWFMVVKS